MVTTLMQSMYLRGNLGGDSGNAVPIGVCRFSLDDGPQLTFAPLSGMERFPDDLGVCRPVAEHA